MRPFVVQSVGGTQAQRIKLLKVCKKEFDLTEELFKYLDDKQEVLKVEVRCVRLDSYAKSDEKDKQFTGRFIGAND